MKETRFRQRISYERELLFAIDDIRRAIMRGDGISAYQGAKVLVAILIPEIRKIVISRFVNDKEIKRLEEKYDKCNVDYRKEAILCEIARIMLRHIIDVLHEHDLLLREIEVFTGEA